MAFVTLDAQSILNQPYTATINPEFINYIIPSSPAQIGKCIITMAKTSSDASKALTVAALEPIAVLKDRLPNLLPATYYSSTSGGPGQPVLVNLARVMSVERNRKCSILLFVDGSQISIVESPA